MKKIVIFFTLFTCKLFSQAPQNFDWLIGNWQMQIKNGMIIENWKKQNDSSYVGFSGIVKSGDTIPSESIELKKIGGKWYFIPTTLNQNEGKPVSFELIYNMPQEFIVENLQHDFPTRINYRKFNNHLFASIEGKINSVFMKKNFDYQSE
jgi:hypothetical protein